MLVLTEVLSQQMSRRTFLARGRDLTAAAAILPLVNNPLVAPFFQAEEQSTTPEVISDYKPLRSILIDYQSPLMCYAPGQQEMYPDYLSLVKELAGNQYLNNEQIMQMYVENNGDLMKITQQLIETNPVFSIQAAAVKKHSIHVEETVNAVMNHILTPLGYSTCPEPEDIIPIQNVFDIQATDRNYHDNINNPGTSIVLRGEKLNSLLDQADFPPGSLILFCNQLGTFSMVLARNQYPRWEQLLNTAFVARSSLMDKYKRVTREEFDSFSDSEKKIYLQRVLTGQPVLLETSDITQFKDPIKAAETLLKGKGAFTGEQAQKNLEELFTVARSHPEQLFFCAIGNFGDDLRELRKYYLENNLEWPENVIFAGQWDSSDEDPAKHHPSGLAGDSQGADVYIDNYNAGLINAREYASTSTSILYACALILQDGGITDPYKIKQILLDEMTDEVEYEVSADRMLFYDGSNLDKVVDTYVDKPKEKVRLFNMLRFYQFVYQERRKAGEPETSLGSS